MIIYLFDHIKYVNLLLYLIFDVQAFVLVVEASELDMLKYYYD